MELENLQCAHCASVIGEKLEQKDYLRSVHISFATKQLKVESDLESEALWARIQETVDEVESGISVVLTEQKKTASEKQIKISDIVKKHLLLIAGVIPFVVALILNPPQLWLRILLYGGAYGLIGGDVVTRAVKNIMKGNLFDENFLMTIATIGAFGLGELTEAAAVMLFYKVGEAFQDFAVDKSRRSIKSLLDIKADTANLYLDGQLRSVDPADLEIGQVILVKPGEKVPVDGQVIEGISSVDSSALTGESMPRSMEPGVEILSGFININSPLKVQVTARFSDSTVSRILDMVESASSKKAKTEQFITRFAKVYTPVVVIGAAALAVIPPLLGLGAFTEWLSRALIFLVISCPCALVLSVPLGYFGGLGAASRNGILIKGGNYLEALNHIDTFVFDKTGTLTKGSFTIEKVSGNNTLELAALLEQHSNHPIALSIVAHYGSENLSGELDQVEEIPGKGLRGNYSGKELLVGNARIMADHKVDIDSEDYPGTKVHVALDGQYEGAVFIKDEIKDDSRDLISAINSEASSQTVMLTGDQRSIADHVGNELAVGETYSELLPQDKLAHVERLAETGRKVLFAGDGINDAPVLARADIGVAMGALGSDAAIEAADMVIMSDQPSKILVARKIARKTRALVLQNIAFALAIKVFFLASGALGEASMYEAIFADVGVALLAVLNSMRILRPIK
ncbi:heavy metal translocating P-type ATPase [Salinispira pacifica]|nr:heavy metal translocating P-type ATPase [Salinispira pacifica]